MALADYHESYNEDKWEGDGWTLHLGDSVEVIPTLKKDSVGLWVFSPPFPGMYAYTNSPRDLGNVASADQMIEQFRFISSAMLPATMPGRSCCVHLTQCPAFKSVDGYIGIKDFRGKVIAMMEEEGWIYYGEVCIDKDPQVKAIRTKDRGLLFKTLAKDSSHMHMALADYHESYNEDKWEGDGWTLHLGDSVEVIPTLKKDSVGLWVFSPPFPGMYAYTNSPSALDNPKLKRT